MGHTLKEVAGKVFPVVETITSEEETHHITASGDVIIEQH